MKHEKEKVGGKPSSIKREIILQLRKQETEPVCNIICSVEKR